MISRIVSSGMLVAVAGVAGLAGAQAPQSPWAMADAPPAKAAAPDPGGLQWQILQNPPGPPAIIVVDPIRQVIAVYHIDSATGVITLKSVRPVAYDLRLRAFNVADPTPDAIQKKLNE